MQGSALVHRAALLLIAIIHFSEVVGNGQASQWSWEESSEETFSHGRSGPPGWHSPGAFDAQPKPAARRLFSEFCNSSRVDEISPTQGSARSWQKVFAYGCGFNASATFVLKFTDPISNSVKSASLESYIDASTLQFVLTDVWGGNYGAALTNVSLEVDGVQSATSGNINFEFLPQWQPELPESINPTIGSAIGGSMITLKGENAGFNSAHQYHCRFALWDGGTLLYSADGTASVTSLEQVTCIVPEWQYHARRVQVSLYRKEGGQEYDVLPRDETTYFEYLEYWYSMAPSLGGATGGETVTVKGLGFDPLRTLSLPNLHRDDTYTWDRQYRLDYQTGNDIFYGTCAVLTQQELACTTPSWPLTQRPGLTSVNLTRLYTFQDGNFYRTIPQSVQSNITSISDRQFAFVTEWSKVVPEFGDKNGGTVISVYGNGFVSEDAYQCQLNNTVDGMAINLTATFVSQFLLRCSPTTAHSSAAWDQYTSAVFEVSISANGQPVTKNITTPITFTFAFINKPPSFQGRNILNLPFQSSMYNLEWVVGTLNPGNFNGSLAADESNQEVKLHVTGSPAGIFLVEPNISNGNLTFQLADRFAGIVTLTVYAQDNGGTSNGGSDVSQAQDFYIKIVGVSEASFDILSTVIEINENDPMTQFVGGIQEQLIQNISTGSSLLQVFRVAVDIVSGDPDLFKTAPSVRLSDGSLLIEPTPYANGKAVVSITLSTGFPGDQEATVNITILVKPVNSRPSFEMRTHFLNFTEMQTIQNQSLSNFISNISAGSPNGNEDSQLLSFLVVPQSPLIQTLFQAVPQISVNGTLSFDVLPYGFGAITFSVYLVDNGEMSNGGFNTSEASNLTIDVTGINNAPSFELESNRSVAYEGPRNVSRVGFAKNISAGSPSGNEDSQVLSFVLIPKDAEMTYVIFATLPRITTEGTLQFTVNDGQYGQATFNLTLFDNGGRSNEGQDSSDTVSLVIDVLPLNTPPGFDITPNVSVTAVDAAKNVSVPGVAFNISLGSRPQLEQDQTITFSVVTTIIQTSGMMIEAGNVSNSTNTSMSQGRELFDIDPYLSADGTLQFGLRPFVFGTSLLQVLLRDDGGTEAGGADKSRTKVIALQVRSVNFPPFFTLSRSSIRVAEGSGNVSFHALVQNISAGSPGSDEDFQSITFIVVPADTTRANAVFEQFPAVTLDGTLSFLLRPFEFGTVDFNITLVDDGGTALGGSNVSQVKQLRMQVFAVNNRPTFRLKQNLSEPGNVGLFLRPSFAQNISAGSPTGNEDFQQVTFVLTPRDETTENYLFVAAPSITAGGMLSFEQNLDRYGVARYVVTLVDDGGTENGGENVSKPQELVITFRQPNQPPVFDLLAVQSVLEQDVIQNFSFANFAQNISAGLPLGSEDFQRLEFTVLPTNSSFAKSLFAELPSITPEGGLQFALNPFENGEAQFTVILRDDGGVQNGGNDTSKAQVFLVRIIQVNNRPAFDLVNSTAEGVGNWSQLIATNITTGSPNGNEDFQTLTFHLLAMGMTPNLFSQVPYVTTDGRIHFSTIPRQVGVVDFKLSLTDDGGSANGGQNTSITQNLTVVVPVLNTAPSFNLSQVVYTVQESSGFVNEPSFAIDVSASSIDTLEDTQSLTFSVTPRDASTANSILVGVPNVTVDGTLQFQLLEHAFGDVVFDLVLIDDGGSRFGGVNTSAIKSFTISVLPVNNAPTFVIPASALFPLGTFKKVVPNFVSSIFDGPPPPENNEHGQELTFSVIPLDPDQAASLFISLPTISIQGPAGQERGTLSFISFPNRTGAATFRITLTDDGGTLSGGNNQSSQDLTLRLLDANEPPRFEIPNSLEVMEKKPGDSLIFSQSGFATNISAGSVVETFQGLTFVVIPQNASLSDEIFLQQPHISANGTLSFSLAPYQFGSLHYLVFLTDDGGLLLGGLNRSEAKSVRIDVIAVNNRPTFHLSSTILTLPENTLTERFGFFTISGFATNISAGSPTGNEDTQDLTFTISLLGGEHDLITSISMSPNGTLTMLLAENQFGNVSFMINLQDSGGTVSGGQDTAMPSSFNITILSANSAPHFDLFAGDCFFGNTGFGCSGAETYVNLQRNQYAKQDQYIKDGFAANISAGASDEDWQALSFQVMQVSGDDLFVTVPVIFANGTLILSQKMDTSGSALLEVRLYDDGGSQLTGLNYSAPAFVTVTVFSGVMNVQLALENVSITDFDREVFLTSIARSLGIRLRNIVIVGDQEFPASARRLLSSHGDIRLSLQVFLPFSDQLFLDSFAAQLADLADELGVSGLNSSVATLGGNTSSPFDIPNPVVVVYEDEGPYLFRDFLRTTSGQSIVSSPNSSCSNSTSNCSTISSLSQQPFVETFAEFSMNRIQELEGKDPTQLFADQPKIDSLNCSLDQTCYTNFSFSLSADMNGVVYFQVRKEGHPVPRVVKITVIAVNDAPTFTISSQYTISETATSSFFKEDFFVTNINAGPPDESMQKLTFLMVPLQTSGPLFIDSEAEAYNGSSLTAWLLDSGPRITVDGNLTFQIHPFRVGNVSWNVYLLDDGPLIDGRGVNLSDPTVFTLKVEEADLSPQFDLVTNVITLLEDCHGQNTTCVDHSYRQDFFAQNISAESGGEADHANLLFFTVAPVDCQVPLRMGGTWQDATRLYSVGCPRDTGFPGVRPGFEHLFSQPVQIFVNGTVVFGLLPQRHGTVRFEVRLHDNGGSAGVGGIEVSQPQSLTIVISRINDAPSLQFTPISVQIEQGCKGFRPSQPYPNGWTWSEDEASCYERYDTFVTGCWIPTYECNYQPLSFQATSSSRRLLTTTILGNNTENGTLAGNRTTTNCTSVNGTHGNESACGDTYVSAAGEVLLLGITSGGFIQRQSAFKAGIAAAMAPIDVTVQITQFVNFSGIPFSIPASTRRLLQNGQSGVIVSFRIPTVFIDSSLLPLISNAGSTIPQFLLQAGFEATVLSFTAVQADGPGEVDFPATFCVIPDTPPRVQCADGMYVRDDVISNIRTGEWGEEDQTLWFEVVRVEGPDLGPVSVSLQVLNFTGAAILEFSPVIGQFGNATYDVILHDSGGTENGGVDQVRYSSVISIMIPGENTRPSFLLSRPFLEVAEDSSCVESPTQGGCEGICKDGYSICVGGLDNNTRCSAASNCRGSCFDGQPVAVSVSCQGTCSCLSTSPGVLIAQCSGLGICQCEQANNGAACTSDNDCTGNGNCRDFGNCQGPLDDGSVCVRSSDCSNLGFCEAGFGAYRRHVYYNVARNVTAGTPAEDGNSGTCTGGSNCNFQSVTFTVVPVNASSANSLFSALPNLSPSGTLSFNLTSGQYGEAEFTVTLRDDSGDSSTDTSISAMLTISVTEVIDQVTFQLANNVSVFEDSGPYTGRVAKILATTGSTIRFEVAATNLGLYQQGSEPRIDGDGTLSFITADGVFGRSELTVQIFDATRPALEVPGPVQSMVISVQAVNDAPTFTLTSETLPAAVNSGTVNTLLAVGISAGHPNEECSSSGNGCEMQSVSFVVQNISDPTLFLWLPQMDAMTGILRFKLAPDRSGFTTFDMKLVDDGQQSHTDCINQTDTTFLGFQANGVNARCLLPPAKFAGKNSSSSFRISVEVSQEKAVLDLRLLWRVDCQALEAGEECQCPSLDLNPMVQKHAFCTPLPKAFTDDYEGGTSPLARIDISGDQGREEIDNFAITVREGTYIPASVATFQVRASQCDQFSSPQAPQSRRLLESVPLQGGEETFLGEAEVEMSFISRHQDADRSVLGLEYATKLVYSPDGSNAYAVESETDSISVWRRNATKGPQTPFGGGDDPEFMERRSNAERQIKYRGVGDPPPFRADPVTFVSAGVCDAAAVQIGTGNMIALGRGCEDLDLDREVLRNSSKQSMFGMIAEWDFTAEALYGDHKQSIIDFYGDLDWTTDAVGNTQELSDGVPAAMTSSTACESRWCLSAYESTGNLTCTSGRGCSYVRPSHNLPNCREPSGGVSIWPATIKNQLDGGLTSLVFPGPKCRTAPESLDWAANAKTGSFSPINFLVNNGRQQAMQFDGANNPGVYLTNDIRALVDKNYEKSMLPRNKMSLEAWVTVDQHELTGRGWGLNPYEGAIFTAQSGMLVGETDSTSPFCAKGFGLSYTITASGAEMAVTFRFQVSLQKTGQAADQGRGTWVAADAIATNPVDCADICADILADSAQCNCLVGRWIHIVATYDGSNLDVYLDGHLIRRKQACSEPPCGEIVYPVDFHPTEGNPSTTCTAYGPVPVMVGNYVDRSASRETGGRDTEYPHYGMIAQLAIYSEAVPESHAFSRFQSGSDLYSQPMHYFQYWSKVDGISPSIDFIDVETTLAENTMITIRGLFDPSKSYSCVHHINLFPDLNLTASATLGSNSFSVTHLGITKSFRTVLECPVPQWVWGYKSSTLSIYENNKRMWQKLCLQPQCGYKDLTTRYSSSNTDNSWFLTTTTDFNDVQASPCAPGESCRRAVISPAAHGTPTVFRYVMSSKQITYDTVWRRPAALGRVEIINPGVGYTKGLLIYGPISIPFPATTQGVDPTEVEGFSGTIVFEPPGETFKVVFSPGCSVLDAQLNNCAMTEQTGLVTAILKLDSGVTHGCNQDGLVLFKNPLGMNFTAHYTVTSGAIDRIYFMNVSDRGNSMVNEPELTISDTSCMCSNSTDFSLCLRATVVNETAQAVAYPLINIQEVSDLGRREKGTYGKEKCLDIPGCSSESESNKMSGTSRVISFRDSQSNSPFVLAANYHDGVQKQVNSTLWVPGEQGVFQAIQDIPTAAAVDVKFFDDYLDTASNGTDEQWPYVVIANFHGPSMLYRWTGGSGIVELLVKSRGQNYAAGRLHAKSLHGSGFAGNFSVDAGMVESVKIFAPGTQYFSDTKVLLTYAPGCAETDHACDETEMTGSVVELRPRNLALITGCTGMDVIQAIGSPGSGFRASFTIDVNGEVNGTKFLFPEDRGSGYLPASFFMFSNSTTQCLCNLTHSFTECFEPVIADGAELMLLPQQSIASPVLRVEVDSPGEGYIPGTIRASTAHVGSGFLGSFTTMSGAVVGMGSSNGTHGSPSSRSILAGQVTSPGSGYFPDLTLDLFFGPLCARNDANCSVVPQTSAVTIIDMIGGTIHNCMSPGSITMVNGSGFGFKAVFTVRLGTMYHIEFENPEDHGFGYDPSDNMTLVLNNGTGCLCNGTTDFSACLKPRVGFKGRLVPQPQHNLRPDYCTMTSGCRDMQQRQFRHPWFPHFDSTQSMPLDLTRPWSIDTGKAVAVEAFRVQNRRLIAFAGYGSSSSSLFELMPSMSSEQSIEIRPTQSFQTDQARDVAFIHSSLTNSDFLLFSQQTGQSLLYRYEASRFVLVQHVASLNAGRINILPHSNDTLVFIANLAGEADSSSMVLRLNGTHLLGVQDEYTLPRDSAAGQRLPSSAATSFVELQNDGDFFALQTNRINCSSGPWQAAPQLGCSQTNVYSRVYQKFVQDVPQMERPEALVVSPDGAFVYVAAFSSRSISAFRRDNLTGALFFWRNASFYQRAEDNLLNGVTGMAISPDGKALYCSAAGDNAVYVFSRDVSTGGLVLTQLVSDGDTSNGKLIDALASPTSLAVTADFVLVGAQTDQSLSAFSRTANGTLEYIDRIRAGERLVDQFQNKLENTEGTMWKSSSSARKLLDAFGGSKKCRKVTSFSVNHQQFLAVALERDEAGEKNGSITIFAWDAESFSFSLFQNIELPDESPADVEHFVEGPTHDTKHLLVVVNMVGNNYVYYWRGAMFVLYQVVPNELSDGRTIPPFSDNDSPLCSGNETNTTYQSPGYQSDFLTVPPYSCRPSPRAQRVAVASMDSVVYMAVAYKWAQPADQEYKWYSVVYRWNREGFAVLPDDTVVQGFGFEVFQIIPTSGATDVEFASINQLGSSFNLLIFSNNENSTHPTSYSSESTVWSFRANGWNPVLRSSAGVFDFLQSLPTTGAVSVHTFSIPSRSSAEEELIMLAVGSSQPGVGQYLPLTSLYSWNGEQFDWLHTFNQLWGVQDVISIIEDAEVHLVFTVTCDQICQSAANATLESGNVLPVTSSSVLQWDRQSMKFDRLMAITDSMYNEVYGTDVPSAERRIHDATLHLPGADGVHSSHFRLGDLHLLVLSSSSEGPILMDWDFPRVYGLEAITAITTDSTGANIFTAALDTYSVGMFRLRDRYDQEQRLISKIRWDQVWSEIPLAVSRVRSSVYSLVEGVAGAYSLELYPLGCTLSNCSTPAVNVSGNSTNPSVTTTHAMNNENASVSVCTHFSVKSNPPRHNLPCGPFAPIAAFAPSRVPAKCVKPVINITQTDTTNTVLLEQFPQIQDGVLTFSPRVSEIGSSNFSASVVGSSSSQSFVISVDSIRYTPSFKSVRAVVLEDGVDQLVKFGDEIASGVFTNPASELSSLVWVVDPAGPQHGCNLISEVTFLLQVAEGEAHGLIRVTTRPNANGQCNFTVILRHPEAPPGQQDSIPTVVTLQIVPVNDAPQYRTQPVGGVVEITIPQGLPKGPINPSTAWDSLRYIHVGGEFTYGSQSFCERETGNTKLCICASDGDFRHSSNGQPIHPQVPCMINYTLTATYVGSVVDETKLDNSVIRYFNIGPSEGFVLEVDPHRYGDFMLIIKVQDQDGTEFGGVDSFNAHVLLHVTQVIELPTFNGFEAASYDSREISINLDQLPTGRPDTVNLNVFAFNEIPLENISATSLTLLERDVLSELQYNNFLSGFYNGGIDQQRENQLSVHISVASGQHIFRLDNGTQQCVGCPVVNVVGDVANLAFTLEPFQYGVSTLDLVLRSNNTQTGLVADAHYQVDIIVIPVNNPPTAAVPSFLGVSEGDGRVVIPHFATGISAGPSNEAWQEIVFEVLTQSATPQLFAEVPRLFSNGTLVFQLNDHQHGNANLTIFLSDTGGSEFGGSNSSMSFPKVVEMKVFPLPRIMSVTPCVGTFNPGWTVTIHGQYFGSSYSRELTRFQHKTPAENVSVLVGDAPCLETRFVSDVQMTCKVPGGSGRKSVTINITGGQTANEEGHFLSEWTRSSTFAPGIVQAEVYYAGELRGFAGLTSSGFLGVGPDAAPTNLTSSGSGDCSSGTCTNRTAATMASADGLSLTRTVRTMTTFQERVIIGGSFIFFRSRVLSYCAAWDGVRLEPVAGGVDGTVYHLQRYRGNLIVGGAFSLLYGAQGSATLRSGGLGQFDGHNWGLIGDARVGGSVTITYVDGDLLYVAGRFRYVGDMSAMNIAVWDGTTWAPLGEGLRARDVYAMAKSDAGLYVGGEFTRAGGKAVSNLARWEPDTQTWHPMSEFNAVVRSLAAVGNRLIAGGDFSLAGTTPLSNIAQFTSSGEASVVWTGVGSGVSGPVHAIQYVNGCFYVGGQFETVSDSEGTKEARNIARWCEADDQSLETWEPVIGMPGSSGGLILSISATG